MTEFAARLHPNFEMRPEFAGWLSSGLIVVAMHAAIIVGLGRLTPDLPPADFGAALDVEFAPFATPIAVEREQALLAKSETARNALAPVRQSGAIAGAAPAGGRQSSASRGFAATMKTASASSAFTPASGRAPAERTRAADAPYRMQPVDQPRTVVEAIEAAAAMERAAGDRVPPLAPEQDRGEPARPETAAHAGPRLSASVVQAVKTARPSLRPPVAILAGAVVSEMPDGPAAAAAASPGAEGAAPDTVDRVPSPRPVQRAVRPTPPLAAARHAFGHRQRPDRRTPAHRPARAKPAVHAAPSPARPGASASASPRPAAPARTTSAARPASGKATTRNPTPFPPRESPR